jgi:hypothetical protein
MINQWNLGQPFFKQTHVPKMIDSNRPRFSVPEAIDTKSEACCCTQHTQLSQEVLFMFFFGCDTLSIFVYLCLGLQRLQVFEVAGAWLSARKEVCF